METVKLTGKRSININPELWATVAREVLSTHEINATRWEVARAHVRQHLLNKGLLIELEYETISQWQGESSDLTRYAVRHQDSLYSIDSAIAKAIRELRIGSTEWGAPIPLIDRLHQAILDSLPPEVEE